MRLKRTIGTSSKSWARKTGCWASSSQKKHLKLHALRGVEIVDGVTRLAAMNLLLHGVGPTGKEAEPPVKTDDSLRSDPSDRFDLVLTNPPFGKKSSVMVVNDFWLEDDSLEDSANLEDPDVIAAEIVEDLRAALEEFELILGDSSS